jgi:hypothetical protein
MAFCENCGTQLQEGNKFCPSCGLKTRTAAKTPAPAEVSGPVREETKLADVDEASASDPAENRVPSSKQQTKKKSAKAPDISPGGQYLTITNILNQSVPYGFWGGSNDTLKKKASQIIHAIWKQGEQAGTVTVDEVLTALDQKLGLTGLGSKTEFLNKFRSSLIHAVAKGYLPLITI